MSHDDEYVEFVTPRLAALRRLAYQFSGDWHRADDLVQTTLTKVLLHWKRVRATADMDQYVRAILVKTFLTERSRAWSRVRLVDAVPDRPAAAPHDTEEREVLRYALSRLPKRQRAAVVLRYLCDLSVIETAQLLRCSPGTVKSQTHHALAALRADLGAPVTTRTES